jgi:translation elongation factor EF-G
MFFTLLPFLDLKIKKEEFLLLMLVAVEIFGSLVVISFSEIILLSFQVPLNNMFGYSTALRSMTQVKLKFYCK